MEKERGGKMKNLTRNGVAKDFGRLNDCAIIIRATSDESWSEIYDDLNTCFGGEEWENKNVQCVANMQSC